MAHKAIGPGSVVASRFRLEDLLDEDAGARFWRATDLTLVRSVALHVVDADDPRAGAALTAARTSATVSDAHILRVLDALEEDGFVHVVHEWGSGVSLDRMLAEGPLEPRRAAWLVREVADAIAVAHRHGVAHGRLVPENVLLTDVGSVKLIGFVVDAVLRGRPRQDAIGGPPPSEHESDVLNLGALLYACLTGRWAGFPASTLARAPLDHGRVCRPRQVRAGVPRQLDAVCDQVLNADLLGGERRFESAASVSAALSEYLGDGLSSATVAVHSPTMFLDAPPRPAAPATADPQATQPAFPLLEPTPVDPGPRPRWRPSAGPRPAAGSGAGTAAGGGTRPRTGMGGGAAPSAWGPDPRPDRTTAPAAPPDERPGTSWFRLAAVVATVVALLVVVVIVLSLGGGPQRAGRAGGHRSGSAAPTGAAEQVLTPAAVHDFDPDHVGGSAEENSQQVPLATDGDRATAWTTVRYNDGPVLAPYKAGVGLLVDLGADKPVGDVTVRLVGSPYDLELLAAPRGASAAPASTTGLTTVDTRKGVAGEVQLTPAKPLTTRYLVVWLTALPRVPGGYQGGVAEVSVRS